MNRTSIAFEIAAAMIDLVCVVRAESVVGECPVWAPETRQVWWVDIQGRKIHRFSQETHRNETWGMDDIVTAIAPRASGGLIISLRKEIAYFDPATGAVSNRIPVEADRPDTRINDGKCDAVGRFWIGTTGDREWNQPVGALYSFNGSMRLKVPGVRCSNGLGWSPDGRTLYFTESFAYAIHAYDFDPATGGIDHGRVFVQMDPRGGFPDGLTVDAEGGVWSAQPLFGRVARYDVEGRIERAYEMPVSRPTSCAFGGDDLRTLFITSARETLTPAQVAEEPLAGSLFACETGVRGLPAAKYREGVR